MASYLDLLASVGQRGAMSAPAEPSPNAHGMQAVGLMMQNIQQKQNQRDAASLKAGNEQVGLMAAAGMGKQAADLYNQLADARLRVNGFAGPEIKGGLNPDGTPNFSGPKTLEMLRTLTGNAPKYEWKTGNPGDTMYQVDERGGLTGRQFSIPGKPSTSVTWGQPYQMNGQWVQKGSNGQIKSFGNKDTGATDERQARQFAIEEGRRQATKWLPTGQVNDAGEPIYRQSIDEAAAKAATASVYQQLTGRPWQPDTPTAPTGGGLEDQAAALIRWLGGDQGN